MHLICVFNFKAHSYNLKATESLKKQDYNFAIEFYLKAIIELKTVTSDHEKRMEAIKLQTNFFERQVKLCEYRREFAIQCQKKARSVPIQANINRILREMNNSGAQQLSDMGRNDSITVMPPNSATSNDPLLCSHCSSTVETETKENVSNFTTATIRLSRDMMPLDSRGNFQDLCDEEARRQRTPSPSSESISRKPLTNTPLKDEEKFRMREIRTAAALINLQMVSENERSRLGSDTEIPELEPLEMPDTFMLPTSNSLIPGTLEKLSGIRELPETIDDNFKDSK